MKKVSVLFVAILFYSTLPAQTNTFPSTGNVGIGTTSPTYKLDVNGTSHFAGDITVDVNSYMNARAASDQTGTGRFGSNNIADGVVSVYRGTRKKVLQFDPARLNLINDYDFIGWENYSDLGTPLSGKKTFQIIGSSGNATFSGAFGIGTDNPTEKLSVNGNTLVIGTGYYSNLESKVIASTDQEQSYNGYTLKARGAGGSSAYQWSLYTASVGGGYGVTSNGFDVWEYPNNVSSNPARQRFVIYPSEKNGVSSNISPFIIGPSGKVAVGYLNANDAMASPYALAVNGTIAAKEIVINLNDWPDYVFEPDYDLPSLYSVEKFITKNKHLPDMPSATEVKKNRVDVGEHQALLLKKIEELTMYIVQHQKQIDEIKHASE